MHDKKMVFGTRAVRETLVAGHDIEKVFIQKDLTNPPIKALIEMVKQHQIPFSFVPRQKLNKLSSKNHQGVICIRSAIRYGVLENIIDQSYNEGEDPFLVLLDRITDVRNIGAVARTAESAGVHALVIGKKGSAPLTGDAIKTSAGALNYLPVCREDNLLKTIQSLHSCGIRIIAFSEKADRVFYEVDMNVPMAFLFGSEKDGISPSLRKAANECVCIPMHGNMPSLNVSVATAIALYEAVRQKNHNAHLEKH